MADSEYARSGVDTDGADHALSRLLLEISPTLAFGAPSELGFGHFAAVIRAGPLRIALTTERHQNAANDALLEAVEAAKAGAGAAAVEAFLVEWQHQPLTVPWVPPLPAVDEAYALLVTPDALQPEPEPEEIAAVDAEAEMPELQLSDDACDDLIGMEPEALMGIFSPGRIECMEARIAKTSRQTD